MSGVFISYNRDDGALARRITLALRALDVEVWWDRDMRSVDWRAEIERRIAELAAVVVLWSPRSWGSNSVHDEALLGHDNKRLVHLTLELQAPPPPFHRINGLALDDWEPVVPHEKWRQFIGSLDPLVASAGGCEPGDLVERLAEQEAEFDQRQREIQRAEAAIETAETKRAQLERRAATVRAALSKADAQLEALRKMEASRTVIDAAYEEAKKADTARCNAEAEVARAVTDVEEAECKRDGLRKAFEAWVDEQGGAGLTAARVPPKAKVRAKAPPPPVEEAPIHAVPVPEQQAAVDVPVEPEPLAAPKTADDDAAKRALDVLAKRADNDAGGKSGAAGNGDTRPTTPWAMVIAGVAAVALLLWAVIPRPPAAKEDATTTAANATEVAIDKAPRNWLVGEWGISGDCNDRVIVSQAGNSGLQFEQRTGDQRSKPSQDDFRMPDAETLVTGSSTYKAVFAAPAVGPGAPPARVNVKSTDGNFEYWMGPCPAR